MYISRLNDHHVIFKVKDSMLIGHKYNMMWFRKLNLLTVMNIVDSGKSNKSKECSSYHHNRINVVYIEAYG